MTTPGAATPVEWGGIPPAATGFAALFAVGLATVASGSVAPEARTTLTAFLCLLACAGLGTILFRGTELRVPPASGAFLCFVGFVFFQAIPLDVQLAPSSQELTGMSRTSAISWIPAATLSHGRTLLAMLALFVIGATVFAHPRRMRHLPWAALLVASIVAVSFTIHPFLEHVPSHVADDREGAFSRHVFGTYLNRNHVAAFLVLAILMGGGLFLARRRTLNHRAAGYRRRQVYILALLLLAAAALLQTSSRGGIVSLVIGIAALACLAPRRDPIGRGGTAVFALIALVAAIPLALPEELTTRFLEVERDLTAPGSRRDLWAGALDLVARAPILGHGYGTFADVGVLTQPGTVLGHLEHAHCDPLQTLAETGFLGLNIALWGTAVLLFQVARRCHSTRGDRRTLLAAASLAACVAMAAHSFVDFNLHVPALFGWISLIAGAASGAMATANDSAPTTWPIPRWLLPPAMVVFGLSAAFAAREALAYLAQAERDWTRADQLHPCLGEATSHLAWSAASAEESPRDLAGIRSASGLALSRNPFDARAWRALALSDVWIGDDTALASIRHAVRVTPPGDRSRLRIEFAIQLVSSRRKDLAEEWLRELFAEPDLDVQRLLHRLQKAGALDEDLVAWMPDQARGTLELLAARLLRKEEFDERERILDIYLHREPRPGRYTVRDQVTLAHYKIYDTTDDRGQRVFAEFTFAGATTPAIDSQMMCLNFRGDHGEVEHYFRPRLGTSWHTVHVPVSTPPGEYEVALQAYTNGPRFPLGKVVVADRGLHLTPGRTLPAARAFYRENAKTVVRTDRRRAALDLEAETRLWRRVRFSQPGGSIVVSCSTDAPIRVRLDGTALTPKPAEGARDRRYRLPRGVAEGLLEITLGGGTPTRVERVTVLLEDAR